MVGGDRHQPTGSSTPPCAPSAPGATRPPRSTPSAGISAMPQADHPLLVPEQGRRCSARSSSGAPPSWPTAMQAALDGAGRRLGPGGGGGPLGVPAGRPPARAARPGPRGGPAGPAGGHPDDRGPASRWSSGPPRSSRPRWTPGTCAATNPRLLLLAIYSTVIGMVTEVEVLRALGEEPTARSLVRRRADVLDLLRSALMSSEG